MALKPFWTLSFYSEGTYNISYRIRNKKLTGWRRYVAPWGVAAVFFAIPVISAIDILNGTSETKSLWRACKTRWLYIALSCLHTQ